MGIKLDRLSITNSYQNDFNIPEEILKEIDSSLT